MKKLLIIIAVLSVVAFMFTGCGEEKKNITDKETTTADVSNIEIDAGEIEAGNYTNKSLGFKVYLPDDYDQTTYGELDLSADNLEVTEYDYVLTEKTKGVSEDRLKSMDITVSKDYDSIEKWLKSLKKEYKNNKEFKNIAENGTRNVGYREYSVYEVEYTKDSTLKDMYLVTLDNGGIAIIHFAQFGYDDAVKFIQSNFATI